MRRWNRTAILGSLLFGCPSNSPPETGSASATGSTGAETTDETTGDSTSDDVTGDATTGDATTGDTTTGDATTGDATTGDATTGDATTGVECMPSTSGEDDSTSGTSTTGTTGEPLAPIESWQEYVSAECTAFLGCGCVESQWLGKDLAACMSTREAELADLAAQGLTWDAECAAARVAGILAQCDLAEMLCEASECELFHGTAAFGDPCDATVGSAHRNDGSSCGADLRCSWGACIPLCQGFVGCDGQVCPPDSGCFTDDAEEGFCVVDAAEGDYCGLVYGPACAPGLVCAAVDLWDGTCERPGNACEPCITACEEGLFCDADTALCWPDRPAGAPCAADDACESQSCGADGLCDPVPGEGDPCPQRVCAEGLKCGWPQFCYPIAGLGEPCPGLYHCAAGLECTNAGICEPRPCSYL